MPAHWYYKRELIARDYGAISGYLAPRSPHPDSILWRSRYESSCPEDDILHDKAQYWGKPGVHYHQNLEAGENTLSSQLSRLTANSILSIGEYDPEDFLNRYIQFMLSEGSHNDIYIEESHRNFFRHYGRGKNPLQCGVEDSNISSLSTLTPLLLFTRSDRTRMKQMARTHVGIIHKGETAARAAELYADIVYHLLQGYPLETTLFDKIGRSGYQILNFPFRRWIENHEDTEVVGKLVGNGCPIEDALPATLYLALKYENHFEAGLIANAQLGGDNCHRGILLGTILGAIGGCESIPGDWVGGLRSQAELDALADGLWTATQ